MMTSIWCLVGNWEDSLQRKEKNGDRDGTDLLQQHLAKKLNTFLGRSYKLQPVV